jgi:hypothetical protein
MEPLPRFASYTDDVPSTAWHRSVRARLFAATFIITLALGIGWTLLQPKVYRSSATVLMSAPSAIDADIEEANIQSVAIQSRILLGGDVTRDLLQEFVPNETIDVNSQYLRDVLRVEAIPETNLVEMVAEGEDAALLPGLVNTWIDVQPMYRTPSNKLSAWCRTRWQACRNAWRKRGMRWPAIGTKTRSLPSNDSKMKSWRNSKD